MFRGILIAFLIQNTFAKVYQRDPTGELSSFGDLDDRYHGRHLLIGIIIGDPLWVVHLTNDGLDPKLVLGTSEEQEDFYEAIGPLYVHRPPRVKKDDPNKSNTSNSTDNRTNAELKKDIVRLINKFALSGNIEPDSHLSENVEENNPSIKIYFKGPYTCIVLNSGVDQWHYVLNKSPFPAWFSESHDTFEAPLPIPEDVKNLFYKSLFSLLRVMLNYPL